MTAGWEKLSRPAERAVAVMQARSNCFYADRFESRWGTEAMRQLLAAKVMQLLPKSRVLILEPHYRVEDQWVLRFAEEHGEAALRKCLRQLRRRRRVGMGPAGSPPPTVLYDRSHTPLDLVSG